MKFTHREDVSTLIGCVCYITPVDSTRIIKQEEYFDTLIMQVHSYQKRGIFFLCGDFNSRIGDQEDYIPCVDNVPPRHVIDFKTNSLCDTFIDFLITINCCILNGRNMTNNDFTCRNISVVDYCVVPYEFLEQFDHFNVIQSQKLFSDSCIGVCEPTGIPDHNILSWHISTNSVREEDCFSDQIDTATSHVKFDVNNIPSNFMNDANWVQDINDRIRQIQTCEAGENICDNIYNSFCDAVQKEMYNKQSHSQLKMI